MRHVLIGLAGAVLLEVVAGAPVWAQGTPQEPNFTASNYVSNTALDNATGLAWAPDGSNRLFVALKSGAIRIIQSGSLLTTPFFTEPTVFTSSECGLVGICFDRAFTAGRPYLYAFVTVSASQQQIVRYNATGNTATNRTILKSGLPTGGVNHDGGAIGIGPDDKLYWAVGDLGNATGVDLNTTTLAAKVGRAELDGTAPIDNPLYNAADGIGPKDYIWAAGFRNPFTMTFHPVTGDLWLNVVGTSFEQVFLVGKSNHGGWDNYEGGNQPAGSSAAPYGVYIDPKISYATNVSAFGGCITGGWFYRGTAYPATHRYNFFFGDYNSGKIMRSVLDSAHKNVTATTVFLTGAGSIVDVEEGPDGALYYVSRSGGAVRRVAYTGTAVQNIIVSTTSLTINEGSNGSFTVRLAAAPASNVAVNVAPTATSDPNVTASPAILTFTPTNWSTPETVTVSAATDADTTNDGATIAVSSTGLTTQNVVVTVIDTTVVNGAPTASITQPVNGAVVSGATAEFYGDGTDPQGVSTLVRAEFYVDGVLRWTDTPATPGHYHYGGGHNLWDTTGLADGLHTLKMTVVDSGGLSGSHQITVTVDNSGTATTFNFFALAGDGRVGYFAASGSGGSQALWDAAHDASAGTTAQYLDALRAGWAGSGVSSVNAIALNRGFLAFDTSALPDNAVITSARVRVWVTSRLNDKNDGNDFLVVVQGLQASPLSLTTTDYTKAGNAINNPAEGSNRLDITGIGTGAYGSWTLNATGIPWISKTGYTRLAVREGHDVLDLWPGYTSNQHNYISVYMSEQAGTAQDPILEVTYSLPGATTSTASSAVLSKAGVVQPAAAPGSGGGGCGAMGIEAVLLAGVFLLRRRGFDRR